jgi:hypothetical protein
MPIFSEARRTVVRLARMRTSKERAWSPIRLVGGANTGFCGQDRDHVAARPHPRVIWHTATSRHFCARIVSHSVTVIQKVCHAGHQSPRNICFRRFRRLRPVCLQLGWSRAARFLSNRSNPPAVRAKASENRAFENKAFENKAFENRALKNKALKNNASGKSL